MKRLLTQYWLERAPSIEGWTFYPSRRPDTLDPKIGLSMFGQSFEFGAVWLSLSPDEDDQRVDLKAWHPAFAELDEDQCHRVLFILLDEALGEDDVAEEVGAIEISQDGLVDPVPLHELRSELDGIRQGHQWEKTWAQR